MIARRAGTLSQGGAAAAVLTGTICAAAGWSWAFVLIAFFVSATALSIYRHSFKKEIVGEFVEKGGQRDAVQVAANGGIFALLAAASLIRPSPMWIAAAAGAVGAVTADTWATELGTLAKHFPNLITTGKKVPTGTSGAVTWRGSFAGLTGAATVGVIVLTVGWGSHAALATIVGGVTGSLVDSIVGATLQRQQWCERCGKTTERLVHSCGTTTQPAGGLSWVNNDMVNALSSLSGAVVGAILFS
jgi:uncharacterized protein (TIGR00297 family)